MLVWQFLNWLAFKFQTRKRRGDKKKYIKSENADSEQA